MDKIKCLLAFAANARARKVREQQLNAEKEKVALEIEKAADAGLFYTLIKYTDRKFAKEIIEGLTSLGYVIVDHPENAYFKVSWDDLSITKFIICTPPKPAKITYVEPTKAVCWIWDKKQYDYICPDCGEHSEYVSNFCPNCGGRRYEIKEKENN